MQGENQSPIAQPPCRARRISCDCFATAAPCRGSPTSDHVANASRSMSHHKCLPRPDLHQVSCTLCSTCSKSGPSPKSGPCFKWPLLQYKGAMTMHASNVPCSHLPQSQWEFQNSRTNIIFLKVDQGGVIHFATNVYRIHMWKIFHGHFKV